MEWHNYEQPRMELEADNLEYCQQGCFVWWASAFECFLECLGAWVRGGVWVGCTVFCLGVFWLARASEGLTYRVRSPLRNLFDLCVF